MGGSGKANMSGTFAVRDLTVQGLRLYQHGSFCSGGMDKCHENTDEGIFTLTEGWQGAKKTPLEVTEDFES